MNKTKGIFLGASLLLVAALLLARDRGESVVAPPPGPGSSSQGAVSLHVRPSATHLLGGEKTDLFLDISLTGGEAPSGQRQPINLGLVIDRSGSMAGKKLMDARQAARSLVSRLRDGDHIAIITYGSDVTLLAPSTLISESSRERLLGLIDTITDRGGTFLSGGLEAGRQEVLKRGIEGFINRIVLISDGQANEGITSLTDLSSLAQKLSGEGVSLTTMGVGLDFNERVMTAMAEHGGGHYYFIAASDALAGIFTKELETMLSAVAASSALRLHLGPEVDLVRIFGYTYEREGGEVLVRLPDLYSGQARKIICQLRLPATRTGGMEVARVSLRYRDVLTDKNIELQSVASVSITADPGLAERSKDPVVMARVEQVRASQTLDEAMEAYEQGQVGNAQQALQDQIQQLEVANSALKSKDLDKVVGKLRLRLKGTQAPPASSAGRALLKEGRFEAYKWAK